MRRIFAWRIEELLHWFAQADTVLEAAIASPLTRGELGLTPLPDSVPSPLENPSGPRSKRHA